MVSANDKKLGLGAAYKKRGKKSTNLQRSSSEMSTSQSLKSKLHPTEADNAENQQSKKHKTDSSLHRSLPELASHDDIHPVTPIKKSAHTQPIDSSTKNDVDYETGEEFKELLPHEQNQGNKHTGNSGESHGAAENVSQVESNVTVTATGGDDDDDDETTMVQTGDETTDSDESALSGEIVSQVESNIKPTATALQNLFFIQTK